jgi:hypothetical protein
LNWRGRIRKKREALRFSFPDRAKAKAKVNGLRQDSKKAASSELDADE